MNKKLIRDYALRNLSLLILAILPMLTFMSQIRSALLTIQGEGVLNDIQYTILELRISVTNGTYSPVYKIWNFPLVYILVAIIYNVYIVIKNCNAKDKADL